MILSLFDEHLSALTKRKVACKKCDDSEDSCRKKNSCDRHLRWAPKSRGRPQMCRTLRCTVQFLELAPELSVLSPQSLFGGFGDIHLGCWPIRLTKSHHTPYRVRL